MRTRLAAAAARNPRWTALVLSAGGVALAVALVDLSLRLDVPAPEPERRRARAMAPGSPPEVPLLQLSRVHVAVEAQARARGSAPAGAWQREGLVHVLLDTGTTIAFGTAAGAIRFPLTVEKEPHHARAFTGERGRLHPLALGESLTVSLVPPQHPRAAATPVTHFGSASLHGADVIAPPQLLAPEGGAVRMDLARRRFVACESIAECAPGNGWQRLAERACPEEPDLIAVDATLNGHPGRFFLDTGGPTLSYRPFWRDNGFDAAATRAIDGELTGLAGPAGDARRLEGRWTLAFGAHRITRVLDGIWVVGQAHASIGRCFPAGSIGTDALADCELVLADLTGEPGLLRCAGERRRP